MLDRMLALAETLVNESWVGRSTRRQLLLLSQQPLLPRPTEILVIVDAFLALQHVPPVLGVYGRQRWIGQPREMTATARSYLAVCLAQRALQVDSAGILNSPGMSRESPTCLLAVPSKY